jgi:DNA modification methylase
MFKSSDFEEQHKQLYDTWVECIRVLCDGGIMCINIGDATRSTEDSGFCCWPNYAFIAMSMFQYSWNGMVPLIPIIWKKISNRPNAFLGSGMLPPNAYISQDHEYIAIFRKGGKLRKFPPKDKNRYASAYTKEERDLWFQQTWNIQGAKNAKDTSAFPDEIPYRLIRMFSVIGDKVLDPFCGTGTVMKIADQLDRVGIGYDIVDYIS